MINRSMKLKKYVVIGRKVTIHNLAEEGEDVYKSIVEVYKLKPNTTDGHGGWKEYEKYYYKEIVGGRGTDVEYQEGQSYLTVDGTLGDFIDINFPDIELETNEFRFCKTYLNKNFLKRERETTFHKEINIGIQGV